MVLIPRELARALLLGAPGRRPPRQLLRPVHQHDAVAARIAHYIALGVQIAQPLEDDAARGLLYLVDGPRARARRVAEEELVAVDRPGAGAVGDAGVLAVDGHRQRQPADTVDVDQERAALGEHELGAIAVGEPGARLADLDQLVVAGERCARADGLHRVLARGHGR